MKAKKSQSYIFGRYRLYGFHVCRAKGHDKNNTLYVPISQNIGNSIINRSSKNKNHQLHFRLTEVTASADLHWSDADMIRHTRRERHAEGCAVSRYECDNVWAFDNVVVRYGAEAKRDGYLIKGRATLRDTSHRLLRFPRALLTR